MDTDGGSGDLKENSKEATSSYKSALHDHHLSRWFGQRLCTLSRGHAETITVLILMRGRVVYGNSDMIYVTWLRHYMIQGVSMA
jgi:hypothetical protein